MTVGGVTWDSEREYRRWQVLYSLFRKGVIAGLKRQVRFPLHAKGGKQVCVYVADFVYHSAGKLVVEDAKGMRLPMYLLKRRWLEAQYGVEIREV